MRKILLSALFTAGIGLAGAAAAAAAPAPAASLVTPAQFVIITPPRHRYRYCYNVRRCYRTYSGRLVCRIHRVCRWRYR